LTGCSGTTPAGAGDYEAILKNIEGQRVTVALAHYRADE